MSAFFKGLLTEVEEGKAPVEAKTYSWGENGKIAFGSHDIIKTTWGTGTYESLGPNRVRATWNNHSHIMTFCGESYASLRIQPMDFDMVIGMVSSVA